RIRAAMASLEIVETHEEAAEQELPPLLVRAPLEEYFDRERLGSGPIQAERIGEGHSNVTYLIRREDERFVLRRPPRPPIPPSAPPARALSGFLGGGRTTRARGRRVVQEPGAGRPPTTPGPPPATIVHGDFRLGNTMFAHGAPARLIAIFDWEMATIGDPLA